MAGEDKVRKYIQTEDMDIIISSIHIHERRILFYIFQGHGKLRRSRKNKPHENVTKFIFKSP